MEEYSKSNNGRKSEKWMWVIIPISALTLVRLMYQVTQGTLAQLWIVDIVLLLGWAIGCVLAESDKVFYLGMCKPEDPKCLMVKTYLKNKQWKAAWQSLKQVDVEGQKFPIKNILTTIVIAGLGIWVISSSGSSLGAGVVYGLYTQLILGLITDKNRKNWFWVIAREFSANEQSGVMLALAAVWVWQTLLLIK